MDRLLQWLPFCVLTLAVPALAAPVVLPMPVPMPVASGVTRVEFAFDNRVRRTNQLPTASLRAARRQMISGGAMPMASLRALADYGDGLAAFRYARLLETMPETNPASIAHYYAIAAYTGRDFAVPPLARLLAKSGESFSASVLKQGLNAMTVQVLSGNSVAASLLGEMYANGTPFGRDLAKAQDLLASNGGTDGPKAALRLGTTLFSDSDDAASGHIGARAALGIAAAGDDLAARVTAENLLRLLDAAPPTDAKATP